MLLYYTFFLVRNQYVTIWYNYTNNKRYFCIQCLLKIRYFMVQYSQQQTKQQHKNPNNLKEV